MQASAAISTPTFTSYQKFLIALLAFLQFTVILDFMIMAPLGALMMPALKMTPAQFGIVVSVYAFSAGISGLLAAGFADRYDRKKFLIFFYVGFLIGTLFCGLATSYEYMLIARMITGLFGGVIGSVVLAITTDLFPVSIRGRVMGFVQSSFAASQVLGIPIGLYLSNLWGWHAPFFMIVGISALVGVVILIYLKPIDEHLQYKTDKNPFHHLASTVANSKYLLAFATTTLLATGGFMLMPFGSDFTVNNIGINIQDLPLMYLMTGIAAFFTGPLVGIISDKFGPLRTFIFGGVLSMIMVVVYTNLGPNPLAVAIIVNCILFVGIFSRMIPSQTMMSTIPEPSSRGAFMAISSSLQQISGGFAAVIAGMIVVKQADGKLGHFDILGYILVGTTLITIIMMVIIDRKYIRPKKA